MIPTERPEKKWKEIIKANISAADRRGNEHNVHSVSEALVCYKSTGNSSHKFQKFLSFFSCLLPQKPCQLRLWMMDTKQWCFYCSLHISVGELTSPELGSTLGRVVVLWKGLSSTPSRSGAGTELGEAAALWAVANKLCVLLLSGSFS